MSIIRNDYENYINSGMIFSSWNNPNTPEDETRNTFMTIAYKFCTSAENSGLGYKIPLKKMMELLQTFDEDLWLRYDPKNNTAEADSFRATLMVAALSYAFSTDMRTEFTGLNFPISNETYNKLMERMDEITINMDLPAGWSMISLPVSPHNASVSSLFPNVEVVYGYKNGKGYVLVKKEEDMEVGKGYWILLNEAKTFTMTGGIIDDYKHEVQDGWYMIGGCTSDAILTTDNCSIGVIYRYVQGTGYQRVLKSENLEPGEGYWILLQDVEYKACLTVQGELNGEEVSSSPRFLQKRPKMGGSKVTKRGHTCF